jgi:hypothetical protein
MHIKERDANECNSFPGQNLIAGDLTIVLAQVQPHADPIALEIRYQKPRPMPNGCLDKLEREP